MVEEGAANFPESVRVVIEEETKAALAATATGSATMVSKAAERNDAFLTAHASSLKHVFEGNFTN